MPCNFIHGDGFQGFQCEPNEYGIFSEPEENKIEPYEDDECTHYRRYELKGVLTCKQCGAIYNENTLEWEKV